VKRKVLIVVHQLNHGGVQKALLTVLNALDYCKNEVTLYVRKDRTEFLADVNSQVHKIIVNQDKTHYYRKPHAVFCLMKMKLWSILGAKGKEEGVREKLTQYVLKCQMSYEKKMYFADSEEYDVVVSYIQGYNAQFVAKYIRAKRKVMFFHGSTDETHELHEQIMPQFDAIVAVNSAVQKVLSELYPRFADKITAIDNYIEASEIREKAKKELVEENEADLVLCSCGRFTDVKGFNLAVDAAHHLKGSKVPFAWYFIGDGPNRTALESQIRKYGLEANIILTGMQDNPYPWMDKCDIYVQPSYEESHSLTIVEAHVLNKPVVTTDTIGGTYLIQDNVTGKIAGMTGESVAENIVYLYQNPEIYENIVNHLREIDYSKAKEEYQKRWETLLEG